MILPTADRRSLPHINSGSTSILTILNLLQNGPNPWEEDVEKALSHAEIIYFLGNIEGTLFSVRESNLINQGDRPWGHIFEPASDLCETLSGCRLLP